MTGENSTEVKPNNKNRSTLPADGAFTAYMTSNWAEPDRTLPALSEAAEHALNRRLALLERLTPGKYVIPAGAAKVRSNDTDYPYRAHSAFTWLTGWSIGAEPDSVLVIDPDNEELFTLYFRAVAPRTSREFYANPAIGEFWTGARPSIEQVAAELGIAAADLSELPEWALEADFDAELLQHVSELRLVKDDFEISEMRAAIASTKKGFDQMIKHLPEAVNHRRGERLLETVFAANARLEDYAVGYDSIVGSGAHACILHWVKNDGPVKPGDLVLIDAGVERESYYTADITRTLPVNGKFSPIQRQVYEAVLEAADAALAIVKPGIRFSEVHRTAIEVIARKVSQWGILQVPLEEALSAEGQQHRRYMVHGTSHHLGIDVHDCAQARREFYHDGIIEEGMIFTIEPGLYFQPDDLTVPVEFRGIGVRIEDDILVTADGAVNLSVDIPRTVEDVEAWLA